MRFRRWAGLSRDLFTRISRTRRTDGRRVFCRLRAIPCFILFCSTVGLPTDLHQRFGPFILHLRLSPYLNAKPLSCQMQPFPPIPGIYDPRNAVGNWIRRRAVSNQAEVDLKGRFLPRDKTTLSPAPGRSILRLIGSLILCPIPPYTCLSRPNTSFSCRRVHLICHRNLSPNPTSHGTFLLFKNLQKGIFVTH